MSKGEEEDGGADLRPTVCGNELKEREFFLEKYEVLQSKIFSLTHAWVRGEEILSELRLTVTLVIEGEKRSRSVFSR